MAVERFERLERGTVLITTTVNKRLDNHLAGFLREALRLAMSQPQTTQGGDEMKLDTGDTSAAS
jgi:hypothetical protein